MHRSGLILFFCLTFYSCTTKFYEGTKIDNITAYKFNTGPDSDTTLYRVSMSIQMNKRTNSMYIPEYGSIKKATTVSFLTGKNSFTLYGKNKNSKKIFNLHNITYLQGAEDFGMPLKKDFDPNNFRPELITDDSDFEDHARLVLNHYFPLNTLRTEEDNKVVIITPFHDLNLPTSTTKLGQIAFMITYKFINGNRELYHISNIQRQRRRGERTWTSVSDRVITDKSIEFINELIQNINK